MNRNLTVGLFVLTAIVLFTGGLFLIGNRHEAFAKHLVIYTDLVDLDGLAKGTKVQVAGMDAGQIESIQIPSSPAAKFHLKVQINEQFHGLIRTDSLATVNTEGVVGNTFLDILPGTAAAPQIQENGVLPSREPIELSDMLGQAKGTMTDVDGAIKNANGLVTQLAGNLNTTLATAQGTLTDVDSVIGSLKRGEGTAGMLLRDQKLADSVRQSIANTQQITTNLQTTSVQANQMLADIRSRNFPQKIDETLGTVRDTTMKLDDVTTKVQKTVNDLAQPDVYGNSLGDNIRDSVSVLNEAAGNMTDDTEALKHNFLLRGYFKRRGYYSLSSISPANYRKDPAFTNAKDTRSWLEASRLFTQDKKGQVTLTAEGKQAIDQTLSQYGDPLEGAPIMVEGYETSGDLADRIDLSRIRAIVVRNYIRDHYHVTPSEIGAIGLSSLPPNGANHPNWDGVCLVILRSTH